MSTDYESDGLDNFDLGQIGMQTGAFGGAQMLFFKDGTYATREGQVIGPEREFVVLGVKKVVRKFVGKQLMNSVVVPNNERVPDIAAMNEAAPRSEWGPGFDGKLQGPYSLILVLKLLDPANLDRFAFITPSKGGAIAIGDLADKTKIMRQFRGRGIAPAVSCSSAPFRIGRLNVTRKRPHFAVLRWITLGPDSGGGLPAPEAPKPLAGLETVKPVFVPTPTPTPIAPVVPIAAPTLPPAPTPASAQSGSATISFGIGRQVTEPSLQEEMEGDAVPF
jgi:hypothetical protein